MFSSSWDFLFFDPIISIAGKKQSLKDYICDNTLLCDEECGGRKGRWLYHVGQLSYGYDLVGAMEWMLWKNSVALPERSLKGELECSIGASC